MGMMMMMMMNITRLAQRAVGDLSGGRDVKGIQPCATLHRGYKYGCEQMAFTYLDVSNQIYRSLQSLPGLRRNWHRGFLLLLGRPCLRQGRMSRTPLFK
jgi:hypothetical protein